MKIILEEAKKYKIFIFITTLLKFFASILDLIIPLLLSFIIDTIVPTKKVSLIILFGILMLISSILAVFFNIKSNRMSSSSATKITNGVRLRLFRKVLYLSEHQVDDITVPSLVSRMTSDTYNIHHMVGMIQRLGIRSPIILIGGIILTMILSWQLALVLFITLPFIVIISYITSKKSYPLYQNVQKKVDRIVEVVRENVTGIRVIKALSKTMQEEEKFENANMNAVKAEKKAAFTIAMVNPSINLILNIGLAISILVGAFLVKNEFIKPGLIIAFMLIFSNVLNAMLMVTRMFIIFSKSLASAKRIEEVILLEEDLVIDENLAKISPENYIVFDNVSFSYSNKENDLDNISFKVKEKESIGIIGQTGSGKSTIINLLLRLYDPKSGNIYIDGKNIRSIPHDVLHNLFGIVFQNDVIFGDTILNNIDFYRQKESSEIDLAINNAQASFIYDFENSKESILSARGTNVSGGQRQRILIARALLNDPKILILDDSSSALDYRTEANLRNVLNEKYQNCTKFIIAQRISSVKNCQKIIVLNDGKIDCIGTHLELLKISSTYQKIYQSQMGASND